MVSEDDTPHVQRWTVLEDYTERDHQYVSFEIAANRSRIQGKPPTTPRWNLDKLDAEKFRTVLCGRLQNSSQPAVRVPMNRLAALRLADATMDAIQEACEASMSPAEGRGTVRSPRTSGTGRQARSIRNTFVSVGAPAC